MILNRSLLSIAFLVVTVKALVRLKVNTKVLTTLKSTHASGPGDNDQPHPEEYWDSTLPQADSKNNTVVDTNTTTTTTSTTSTPSSTTTSTPSTTTTTSTPTTTPITTTNPSTSITTTGTPSPTTNAPSPSDTPNTSSTPNTNITIGAKPPGSVFELISRKSTMNHARSNRDAPEPGAAERPNDQQQAGVDNSESVVDPEGPEPEQQGSTKTKEVEAHS